MNHTDETRAPSNTRATLIGFTLGAVVGAGLALLLAPDSGKKTRERIADSARKAGKGAEHAFELARENMADLGADAKSALRAGRDSFRNDREARDPGAEARKAPAGDTASGANAARRSTEGVAL